MNILAMNELVTQGFADEFAGRTSMNPNYKTI